MATGIFSTKRGADFNPATDCEILMSFTPNRTTVPSVFTKLANPQDILLQLQNPNSTSTEFMGGAYTLKLPSNIFSLKGIYTLLIRPIEIRCTIVDCGILDSASNIRGLILDTASIDSQFINRFTNNGLIGYRLEFLNTTNATNQKVPNYFLIVTSNNLVESVNSAVAAAPTAGNSTKAIRYRLNDRSSLTMLTLTPSSASSLNPNNFPFIGNTGDSIILSNPYFNSTMVEVEFVDYDTESLAIMMMGNSSRSVSDGILSIYNFDNDIYYQANLYQILDKLTGKPQFELKQKRDSLDFTKTWTNISNL